MDPNSQGNSLDRVARGSIFNSNPQTTTAPNFKVEVKSGDSLWKILENLLDANADFKVLGPEKKINVVGNLINIILLDPTKYGIKTDGFVYISDKLDFTSLFADNQRIKSIIDKASRLSEDQKRSTLETNKKIANWISQNPGKLLTPDKVSEVLNSKPAPAPSAPVPPPQPIAPQPVIPKPTPASVTVPTITPPIQKPAASVSTKSLNDYVDKPIDQSLTPRVNPQAVSPKAMQKSMTSDKADSVVNQTVEAAFGQEIDNIYGKKGILGMGSVSGLESKDWIFIRKLPASALLEYYTGDSSKAGFPHEVADELARVETHHEMIKQVIGLMNETKGEVKPYPQETIEAFFKRLGAFVMKNSMQMKSA